MVRAVVGPGTWYRISSGQHHTLISSLRTKHHTSQGALLDQDKGRQEANPGRVREEPGGGLQEKEST